MFALNIIFKMSALCFVVIAIKRPWCLECILKFEFDFGVRFLQIGSREII